MTEVEDSHPSEHIKEELEIKREPVKDEPKHRILLASPNKVFQDRFLPEVFMSRTGSQIIFSSTPAAKAPSPNMKTAIQYWNNQGNVISRPAMLTLGIQVIGRQSFGEVTYYPLYIGSKEVASNHVWMEAQGVGAIVNVTSTVRPPKAFTGAVLQLPVEDTDSSDLTQYFATAFDFIHAHRQRSAVLVHCNLGRSRSVTVTAAYLLESSGMTLREVWAHLNGRDVITQQVNHAFRRQLMALEFDLLQCRSIDLNQSRRAVQTKLTPAISLALMTDAEEESFNRQLQRRPRAPRADPHTPRTPRRAARSPAAPTTAAHSPAAHSAAAPSPAARVPAVPRTPLAPREPVNLVSSRIDRSNILEHPRRTSPEQSTKRTRDAENVDPQPAQKRPRVAPIDVESVF